MIKKLRYFYYKNKYKVGRQLSRFTDKDVKKEIVIINNENLDKGVLTIKERTFNLLYLSKGVIQNIPDFSAPFETKIDSLWK